jgi:DNA mismatch endonuclease (patch repair protein)
MNRSENMSRIRSKDTAPELAVRRLLHSLGYRYRLHHKDLPGKPDIVFSVRRKVIFVHGCYWHAHGCKVAHTPKSNEAYWSPKLRRNVERDALNRARLAELGWRSFVIWECGARSHGIRTLLEEFLEKDE